MNLKLILFYIIGFILLYLEPIQIAGMTFGILWKLVLIFILFLPVIYQTFKEKYIEFFAFIAIIFSFKILISYSSMDYPIPTLTLFLKELMLPILFLFFVQKIKKDTLLFFVKHFSILIVLSFIPYLLGILSPMGEGYDLSAYGYDNEYGLVGPFMNPHTASISLAFALIVIIKNIHKKNSQIVNIFLILLIFIGLYEILDTYVRTGIVIFLISMLYFLLKNITLKKFLMLLTSSIVIITGVIYLYNTNEIVQMRLSDKNKFVQKSDPGSGRLLYWKTAIKNVTSENTTVLFIGLGEIYALDKMEKNIGERLFAHNKFFQVFQREGIIGFLLMLSMLFSMKSFINRYKNSQYYNTTMALFVGLLIEMFFQGGFYFNIVLILGIYLALLKKDSIKHITTKG